MAIALNIDERDSRMEKITIRKQQYIDGINKLSEYMPLFQAHNVKFQISDNTTHTLDEDILAVLPPSTIISCFKNNKYGKLNKGAGLMEVWTYNMDLYIQYDYVIFFEPRTLLNSPLFFEEFFKNPRNLFTNGDKSGRLTKQLYTGIFALDPKLIYAFLENVTMDFLCRHMISIEDIFGDFLYGKIDMIPYADILWKYAGEKEYIRF